jgi:predicted nucleic acid-binding protein
LSTHVLVDTCSFIDYFRGDENNPVAYLASQDRIVLSKVVRMELLKGSRKQDRKALYNLFEGFKQLAEFPQAELAEETLLQLHGRGFNLGFADLLILTDAIRNRIGLLTSDAALASAARALKVAVIPE